MRQRCRLTLVVCASLLSIAGCGGANLQSNFHSPDTTSGNSADPTSTFSLALLPASPNVIAGQSVTFTSPFIGNVVWKVDGVEGGDPVHGTIDKMGNYQSPAVAPAAPVTVSAELGLFAHPPSASASISVQNPSPHIDLVTPGVVIAGTTPMIVFAGSGFNPASQIALDGKPLASLYNDSNHVSAQVPADVLQNAGTFDIAVANPSPGGGIVHKSLTVLSSGEIAATANPQVAAYSISIPNGSSVSVGFGPDRSYSLQTSEVAASTDGGPLQILVAGMKANTDYHLRAAVRLSDGNVIYDEDHAFSTGSLPPDRVPTVSVTSFNQQAESPGVQMLDCLNTSKLGLTVFDRRGNFIWGYNNPADAGLPYFPARQLPNGDFLLVVYTKSIREIDLSGATISELSQQDIQNELSAGGYQISQVTVHHDALKLANDHYLLLGQAWTSVLLNGGSSPTSVLGDVLLDVGPGSKVNWVWNSFDHLDVNRHPIDPVDWTHGNAVALTADGNLLLSMRHQSWIIKIDYRNGTGTGDILWRLGYQGDFALRSANGDTDWFYLQHYPNILSEENGILKLAIFDNGDNRLLDPAGDMCGTTGQIACYSRGLVMDVDETNMTATVEYQHTLSEYSFWGGSIQQMPNGNYVVGMSATSLGSRAEEFTGDSSQSPVWQMDVIGQGAAMYRSLRLPSLYPGVTWK